MSGAAGTTVQKRLSGALWDLPVLAFYLGQPLNSVRRWIHRPPEGFPRPVEIGRKITFRAAEIKRWAEGEAASALREDAQPPSEPQALTRRGRPRNQPKAS